MINATPSINIKEEKNNYRIEVPAPGIKKKNFNIYTEGNKLIISCKNEVRTKGGYKLEGFWQKANDNSYFFRFLSLPDNADSNRIIAKYNGVLMLLIPKKIFTRKNNNSKAEQWNYSIK